MKQMPVVILCGGKGQRLGEKTIDIPKPLIHIGDKPILWHVMKIYAAQGVNNFVLCLGYKHDEVVKYFKMNDIVRKEGWTVHFEDTGLETSKSQRINKVLQKGLVETDEFFLAYGDDVADVNIKKLLNQHKKYTPTVTISIVRLISEFGVVLSSPATGAITRFNEKPILDEWMNGGFMVMNKRILDYLDNGELEQEVFNALVSDKQIRAYRHKGQWKAMNTLKDYMELTSLWHSGKAFWKIWEE
jgi:glucose-1-phosphate cytidylyltransferase